MPHSGLEELVTVGKRFGLPLSTGYGDDVIASEDRGAIAQSMTSSRAGLHTGPTWTPRSDHQIRLGCPWTPRHAAAFVSPHNSSNGSMHVTACPPQQPLAPPRLPILPTFRHRLLDSCGD
jgi:hypothetical protein